MKPLLRTHPELEIIDQLPLFIEYRIYNYKLGKNGTDKRRYGYGYSYWDVVSLVVIYFLWNRFHVSFYFLNDCTNCDSFYLQTLWLTGLTITWLVRMKTTQLLWGSSFCSC